MTKEFYDTKIEDVLRKYRLLDETSIYYVFAFQQPSIAKKARSPYISFFMYLFLNTIVERFSKLFILSLSEKRFMILQYSKWFKEKKFVSYGFEQIEDISIEDKPPDFFIKILSLKFKDGHEYIFEIPKESCGIGKQSENFKKIFDFFQKIKKGKEEKVKGVASQ